jgi:hypothetical protein
MLSLMVKKYGMAVLVVFLTSPFVSAETVCQQNLQKMAIAQAAIDFPGVPVRVVVPPIRHGVWKMVCLEVHSEDEPSIILGVYTTEVDEVCELNNSLNPQPTMISCDKN